LLQGGPWDSSKRHASAENIGKRQAALDLLSSYTSSAATVWYLTDIKTGIQVFASERGIDLTIRKVITEEYLEKIKENK